MALSKSALVVLVICTAVLIAGPNHSATAALDFDYRTDRLDAPVREVTPGAVYRLSVVLDGVSSLHSYSVTVVFDQAVVRCDGAVKSLMAQSPALLESRGGVLAAFLVIPGTGRVEVAASQAGKDPAVAAAGTGVAAFLTFTGLSRGNPNIRIADVKLVDANAQVDRLVTPDRADAPAGR